MRTDRNGGKHIHALKIFQRYTNDKAWESAGNGGDGFGETLLDQMHEDRNPNPVATGIDRVRLGRRGIEFFARVFNRKEACYPIGLSPWGYVEGTEQIEYPTPDL